MRYVVVALVAVLVVVMLASQDAYSVTVIDGTEVSWDIVDSKGNTYKWSMPVTTYEDVVVESRYHVRDRINLDLDGETIRTINLDGFVKKSFTNVIDDIYDNSYDNSDFIWEVWYIVSQLTVYDEDVHEYSEGRYALETLTRGGGDCEDLTILVADMLISSEHTDDWTIQYVMMDANNPMDPQTVNHAILYVYDGEYAHYIEATSSPSWDYYPDGVYGWYLDVVLYTNELDFSGQDMRWMDLSYADFNGADLSGADLSWADLTVASFIRSDLSGASLTGADLSWADLRSTSLSGADLSWADLHRADLSGADLSGADLSWADLHRADLSGADLSGADLTGASLYGADLWSADLTGASLPGADLSWTRLIESNLSWADLSWADLHAADLSWANLIFANLCGADLSWADLSSADLTGADLTWAELVGASMHGANTAETEYWAEC